MTPIDQLQRKIRILTDALKICRRLTDELKETNKTLLAVNMDLQETLRDSLIEEKEISAKDDLLKEVEE